MNTALIRPIKTEADYQDALNRAGSLMSCSLNTPEADELEILATLIELYKDKYFPIGLPDRIPIDPIVLTEIGSIGMRSDSDIW